MSNSAEEMETQDKFWKGLKPCPLCTSADVDPGKHKEESGRRYFSIECQSCGIELTDPTRKQLYMNWNHRPEEGSGFFKDHGLFEDRTAHAAATQMAKVLAWMAECELATLSRYKRLKSSSKSETERHQEIADKLIHHLRDLNVPPEDLGGGNCPRLEKLLDESDNDE